MGVYEYTNQPPVADAGADQTVTADTSCRAVVALDGTHMITLTVRDLARRLFVGHAGRQRRRRDAAGDPVGGADAVGPVAGEAAVRRRHYRCVCFAFLPR